MNLEELETLVLQRLYAGAFENEATFRVNLGEFATEKGIDRSMMMRVHEDFRQKGFFSLILIGMTVEPSPSALIYCEDHNLVDIKLVNKQKEIRKTILGAYGDLWDEHFDDHGDGWEEINRRTNLSERDFDNNIGVLTYCSYLQKNAPFPLWTITEYGRDLVKDYRRRKQWQEEFENLIDLVGMTQQTRGHRFESLLADVIRGEGWEAVTNVRPKGKEHDIVINRENDYYLVSCKWESEPSEPATVELLGSRAQEMRCREGILVSMSGFTDNCIKEALKKGHTPEVLLFGFHDIEQIIFNETAFSDLLKEKIKQIKHKNVILLDGEIRD